MPAPTKILFIGLDSAEPQLLLQWSQAGLLPTLQSLMNRGAWGALEGPPGMGNGATWPSLFTGVNPGRHGRCYFRQLRSGSYDDFRFNEDTDFKHEPVWNALSKAGRRVAVLDVVKAPLTSHINGIQLSDWITHDRYLPTRSWPPTLTSRVTSRFGADPLGGNSEAAGRSAIEFKILRDQSIDRIKTKTDFSSYYLEQGGWDLFMTVFADPHDMGHQCWHLHDPGHPKHDPDWVRQFGNPIQDLYVAIDAAIGKLVEQAGPQATVMVFTGPGMGPNYTANFLLDGILRRLEGPPNRGSVTTMGTLKSAYRKIVPRSLHTRIKSLAKSTGQGKFLSDRSWRKYFSVPHNENSGAIRINLVGREPNGQVQPGVEYNALCEALTEDLLDLVNLDTGRRVVKEVIRVSDSYHGDCLEQLPDLFAVWNRDAPIVSIGSPKVGKISASYPGHRTGDHTPNNLLIAQGPTVVLGPLTHLPAVEDVAPTLAALLGVPLPEVDGSLIPALFPGRKSSSIKQAMPIASLNAA